VGWCPLRQEAGKGPGRTRHGRSGHCPLLGRWSPSPVVSLVARLGAQLGGQVYLQGGQARRGRNLPVIIAAHQSQPPLSPDSSSGPPCPVSTAGVGLPPGRVMVKSERGGVCW